MLQKLYIKNFAIITELQLEWQNQLSVITGETGAGKSIILGALGLILGKRADLSVILNKEEKCIIEAQFNVNKSAKVNAELLNREFEIYDEIIIRREISPSGRSRAFINDTPAKLEDVAEIGHYLVDMHRQFDNYELLQPKEQLTILDNYLQLNEEKDNYQNSFSQLKKINKAVQEAEAAAQKAKAEQDYIQFVYDELEELNLKNNDIENWESSLHLLENAQEIKEHLISSANVLLNDEQSIIDSLQIISKGLKGFSDASEGLSHLSERLHSTLEELKDIATEFEIQESNINTDEEQLSIVTEKLALANKLLIKHNVKSTEALIDLREEYSQKLDGISTIDIGIATSKKEQTRLQEKCSAEATELSKKRIAGLKKLTQEVNTLLPDLGFVQAKFEVQHSFKEMNPFGIDEIQFRFDANNVGQMQALQKAVSGGEMSRIMLIIKSLLAHHTEMPCMIFDEIDTGISGETALKVGAVLKRLAQKHQVISITHLPQIAAQAQQHLFVYKEAATTKGAQNTNVRSLDPEERVKIIAEMLSGKQDSKTALLAAEDLLKLN